MPLSMHRISVPLFKQLLAALAAVLEKAEAHCADNGLDPKDILTKRLAPDMFTLIQQVQRETFHSAQAGAKLADVEIPAFDNDESNFDDLQERIRKTIGFLNTLEPDDFEGSEDKELEIQTRVALRKFSGQDFLLHFAIPQFLFHTTTAYDIIRNADIEIGKQDFLGNASTQ